MFQQLPLSEPQVAEHAVTAAIAAKNAGIAAIVAFAVLFLTAYKRVGADDFIFTTWLWGNRNRWINGAITLIIFSTLSVLVPSIGAISDIFGFNLKADLPLSLGLAVAAWLSSVTKAQPPSNGGQL